jgi:prepilin-type N-terminal cleavage/methylation domain-containing protein
VSENGYTLVEMLVALSVVGFTAAGLAAGAGAIHQLQSRSIAAAARTQAHWDVQDALSELLQDQGPFGPRPGDRGLQGGPSGLSFECGSGRCASQLLRRHGRVELAVQGDGWSGRAWLPSAARVSFIYRDGQRAYSVWPVPGDDLPLDSISILAEAADGAAAIATTRIAVGEPVDCAFDTITRRCRAGGA